MRLSLPPVLLLAAGTALLGTPAGAHTPAEATAVVMKFNSVFRGGLTREQLDALLSDDFVEHHPVALGAEQERTKSEFVARMLRPRPPRPAGAPPMPSPPTPVVTMATDRYVLLMTKRDMPFAADPNRTYEAFVFDLFRVNDANQIAEHWDSFKAEDRMGPPPAKPNPPVTPAP